MPVVHDVVAQKSVYDVLALVTYSLLPTHHTATGQRGVYYYEIPRCKDYFVRGEEFHYHIIHEILLDPAPQ